MLYDKKVWKPYGGENRKDIFSLIKHCIEFDLNLLLIPPAFKSSGIPKIVVHKLENLFKSANSLKEHYPILSGLRFLHYLPTHYMAGVLNTILLPAICGGSIVLDEVYSGNQMVYLPNKIKSQKIQMIWSTPNLINAICALYKNKSIDTDLKLILHATGPLNMKKRDLISNIFDVTVLNTYGLTEILFVSGEQTMKQSITIGETISTSRFIYTNQTLRIFSTTFPSAVLLFNPETMILKQEKLNFNFFETNDLYYNTNNGVALNGRIDDIVKFNGVSVSLDYIENIANSFNSIFASCARVSNLDTMPFLELLIEIEPSSNFSLSEFKNYLVNNLSKHEIPKKIIPSILEKLPNGKIDRVKIRKNNN
jgi:long-chain acyl-CoA synthetase